MIKNKYVKVTLLISLTLFLILFLYFNFFQKNTEVLLENDSDEILYKSNILKDVKYITKDNDGNKYIIEALEGEIDFSNPNIIYLTKVNALIKIKNSDQIVILSDYGKYNSENFDTIFSKNVIIEYLNNKINGEYLDFSLKRNSMIVSKNVVYKNLNNSLKADVVEMNIKTKDTKIFMYEKDKQVNINNQ